MPRKHRAFQLLERVGIAKETGDVDQHVAIERFGFRGIALDEPRVVAGGPESTQDHAARRAALERGVAVLAEIHTAGRAKRRDDPLKLVLHFGLERVVPVRRVKQWMRPQIDEPRGDLLGRHHQIHRAAGNGALRHPAMLGGGLVLRERQPAGCFDLAQPQRAVGSRARQDDADGARPLYRRERSEKVIDRVVRTPLIVSRCDGQETVGECHVRVGLDDVCPIRDNCGSVLGFNNLEAGACRENAGELAFLARIQVLNDDQRKSRLVGKRRHELGDRVQTPAEAPTPTIGNACSEAPAISRVYGGSPLLSGCGLVGIRRDVPGHLVRIVLGSGPHVPAPFAPEIVHVRRAIDRRELLRRVRITRRAVRWGRHLRRARKVLTARPTRAGASTATQVRAPSRQCLILTVRAKMRRFSPV